MRFGIVAAILPTVLAVASGPALAEPPRSGRELNGHVFMPSLVSPPLAVTSFSVGLLLGLGGTRGPQYNATGEGTGGTTEYSYAALGQSLLYEFAFLGNFTARAHMLSSLYSGRDGRSALVVGATVRIGGGAGLTWSHQLGKQFRLGASFDVDYSPQLNLLVIVAVLKALQGDFDPRSAFQQDNVLTMAPAVTAAWAPGAALGFTAQASYVSSSLDTDAGTFELPAVSFGLAGEVDFGKFTPAPIGLNLAYRQTIGLESSQADVWNIAGAILYTGKPELSLGVEMVLRTLTIRPEYDPPLKTTFPIAQVFLRYYWL